MVIDETVSKATSYNTTHLTSNSANKMNITKNNNTEPMEPKKLSSPNYINIIVNEWQVEFATGIVYFTTSRLKPAFNYTLENWNLTMEFREPLVNDMRVWIATGFTGTANHTKVVLTPLSWNRILKPNFLMTYETSFNNKQNGNHLASARFCGTRTGSELNICDEE